MNVAYSLGIMISLYLRKVPMSCFGNKFYIYKQDIIWLSQMYLLCCLNSYCFQTALTENLSYANSFLFTHTPSVLVIQHCSIYRIHIIVNIKLLTSNSSFWIWLRSLASCQIVWNQAGKIHLNY